jgi:hypothetical protein
MSALWSVFGRSVCQLTKSQPVSAKQQLLGPEGEWVSFMRSIVDDDDIGAMAQAAMTAEKAKPSSQEQGDLQKKRWQLWAHWRTTLRSKYPLLIMLVECVAVAALTSVEAERFVSHVGLTQKDRQAAMGIATISSRLRVRAGVTVHRLDAATIEKVIFSAAKQYVDEHQHPRSKNAMIVLPLLKDSELESIYNKTANE